MWWIIGYIIGFFITYIIVKFRMIDTEEGNSDPKLKNKWGGVLLKFILALFWPETLVIFLIALVFIGIDELLEKDPPKWL